MGRSCEPPTNSVAREGRRRHSSAGGVSCALYLPVLRPFQPLAYGVVIQLIAR